MHITVQSSTVMSVEATESCNIGNQNKHTGLRPWDKNTWHYGFIVICMRKCMKENIKKKVIPV